MNKKKSIPEPKTPKNIEKCFNKVLLILVGCSGSGKTTYAEFLKSIHKGTVMICTADDYFMKDGEYNFDASKLGAAHDWCKRLAIQAMDDATDLVIIANTNTKPKEWRPYRDAAKRRGYKVFSIVMQNIEDTKNIHGVPDEVLDRQAFNIVNNIKLK